MRALLVIALLGAGCSLFVGDDGGGGVEPDAARLPSCEDWQPPPRHFSPCSVDAPSDPLELTMPGTYVLDTDDQTLVDPADRDVPVDMIVLDPNGTPTVLIFAARVVVGSSSILRAEGTRPIILASLSSASIAGEIDVDSPGAGGAGSNPVDCSILGRGGPGTDAAGAGSGGGGGGGFQTVGGEGGEGSLGGVSGGSAGATVIGVPVAIRGGCGGGAGGANGGPGASAGRGGGAVEIAAFESVAVSGRIRAGGGRGAAGLGDIDGSNSNGGGGGAGSGGWISIDAPSVVLDGATLAANGGGGGGGGANGITGESGQHAHPDDTVALGGQGADGSGGVGGNGAANTTGAALGDVGGTNDGGGGGGGGAGWIIVFSTQDPTGAFVSSPPAVLVRD